MAGGLGGGPGGFGGGRFHYIEINEKPNISKSMLKKIAKYFLPYWKLLILLAIAIIITSILGLLPAIFTKNIIDIALPQKNINLLLVLIVSSFGAVLFSGLITVGQNYLNSWIAKYIMYDIRNSMFNHIQHMGIRFFSNVKTGEITSLMNNDIGGIETIFSTYICTNSSKYLHFYGNCCNNVLYQLETCNCRNDNFTAIYSSDKKSR